MVVTFPLQRGSEADISHRQPVVTMDQLDALYRLQNNCMAAFHKVYDVLGMTPGETMQVGPYSITAFDIRQSIKSTKETARTTGAGTT